MKVIRLIVARIVYDSVIVRQSYNSIVSDCLRVDYGSDKFYFGLNCFCLIQFKENIRIKIGGGDVLIFFEVIIWFS